MEQPASVDLHADRWVACIRDIPFLEIDFTGGVFVAQVRQTNDAGGSPLIDLATTTSSTAEGIKLMYAGSATITAHIAAGRLDEVPDYTNPTTGLAYAAGDTVTLSHLRMRINETTMEGLPYPEEIGQGERGDSLTLAWDMHITPSGGVKDKYAGGAFIVRAGATE